MFPNFPNFSPELLQTPLPRAGVQDNFSHLSNVPETVALEPFPGVQMPARGPHTDLSFLRSQFPFLPIMPLPHRVVSAVLTANVPFELSVPDDAVIGQFSGNGEYYVSHTGVAEIPVAGNTSASRGVSDTTVNVLASPEKNIWYLGGVHSFSIISSSALVVQLLTWKASNLPQRY